MSQSIVEQALPLIAADEALQQRLSLCADREALIGVLSEIHGTARHWHEALDRAAEAAMVEPVWSLAEVPPRQWLPTQVYRSAETGGLRVEWLHFAFAPLEEPFFEQSIARARILPINLLLRCSTPLDCLQPLASAEQPDSLVFHISRCGSTLVGQLLRALGDVHVVPEPPALDTCIQLWLEGQIPPQVVQGMAGALGRPRAGPTRHRAVKVDAWHSLSLGRIADLFPQARSIFLFRDPIEVLASHAARPGMHVRRGELHLASYGLAGAEQVSDADFAPWVIGAVMKGGLAAAGRSDLLLCDYADLPASMERTILPHLRIPRDAAALRRMREAGTRYSKDPSKGFVDDRDRKQAAADESVRERAAVHGLPATHAELGRLSRGRPAAVPPRPMVGRMTVSFSGFD
jgi:hypothetical protein